jgi:hypothetical protein
MKKQLYTIFALPLLLLCSCHRYAPVIKESKEITIVNETQMFIKQSNLSEGKDGNTDMAPFELLRRAANIHAKELWGNKLKFGEPLPILDATGNKILYAFPFLKILQQKSPANSKLKKYGTIYVSTSKERYPIPRVSHGAHPYYYNVNRAIERARREFDIKEPVLKCIRFIPPCYEYFEIGSNKTENGTILRLHVHTLISEEEFYKAYKEYGGKIPDSVNIRKFTFQEYASVIRKDIKQAWQYFENPQSKKPRFIPDNNPPSPPSPVIEFRIPHYVLVPPILWTRWCAPTAMSMVFAYWDHYVPNYGAYVGSGRIVDYWHEHSSNGNNNVPNLMDEVVDLCSTYEEFTNIRNGYNWTFDSFMGSPQNDWGWPQLVSELIAGRPLRLELFGSNIGHSICCFGYRIASNGNKYVIVYTTWSQSEEEWLHNSCSGIPLNNLKVDFYRPGGLEANRDLRIYHPYGGEIYTKGQKNKISFIAGSDIKLARVSYSKDGGQTWSFVVELAVNPGVNNYWWKFPIVTTTRARIRIKGFSLAREYLSGDGSYTNFTLE